MILRLASIAIVLIDLKPHTMMKSLMVYLITLLAYFFLTTNLNAQCDASFSTVVDCNCVTFRPSFVDSTCNYTWDFGLGGNPSNVISPRFCYPFTGNDLSNVNVSLNIDCSATSGVTCDSTQTVIVQQIPEVSLIPLNAPGWLNCRPDPTNPDFLLGVEINSTTDATNTQYIINWGDSILVNGQMVANIDTINPGDSDTLVNTYKEILSYDIEIIAIGQNGCSTIGNYEFTNASSSPHIGFELDGASNECVGYVGRFIISNTEENPDFTKYLIRIDDGIGDSIWFSHPPPDTFEYVFNTGSCFDTTTIGSEIIPHSFSVTINAIHEGCGTSVIAAGPIYIDEPPLADFDIAPDISQCELSDTFHITNESMAGNYNLVGQEECSDSTWYYWDISPNANFEITEGVLGVYDDFPIFATPGSAEGFSVVFDEPGTYTISLVAKSSLASVCDTSMAVQTICVLPQPIAAFTPSTLLDCSPSSITFTNNSNTLGSCESAIYNYSVDFLDSECGSDSTYEFIGSNPISPTIQFLGTGQYRVQLEVINRCDTAYYEEVITMAQPSVVAINPIENACLSTPVDLGFENLNECYAPVTCVWYFPKPDNPSEIDSVVGCNPPSLFYNVVGIYQVSVQVSNDCGLAKDTTYFEIFDLPSIPTILSNSSLCEGEDLCLSALNLFPHQIVQWTGPAGWSSNMSAVCIDSITLVNAGSYHLMITDTLTECSNDTTINVNIIQTPFISIQPQNPAICIGDSVVINVTGNGMTFIWSPSIGLNTTTGPSVVATPITTTIYTLTTTDNSTGCTREDLMEVTINALPIVEAGADTLVCAGENLQLGGHPDGGVWLDEQGNILINNTFNETTPQWYTVYYLYSDENNCSSQDSLNICVLNQPQADFILDTLQACIGEAINASNNSNTLDDCIAADYTWSVIFENADCHDDGSAWSFLNSDEKSINPTFVFQQSGIYRIQLEVANACDTVQTNQTIMIGEAPTVEIDSFDVLCADFTVQPSANVSTCNSATSTSYEWAFPGADITIFTGAIAPMLTYPGIGVYTISLTVTNICGSTTTAYTFEIFDLPLVTASNDGPVCENDDLQLIATSSTAISYQWTGPSNFDTLAMNVLLDSIRQDQGGWYEVLIKDTNGCPQLDSTFVEVLEQPSITVDPANSDICFGDSVIINLTGADEYMLTPTIGLNTNTGSFIIAAPDTTTNYLITGMDTITGCSNTSNLDITVNSLPIVEAGVDTFVCAGADLVLGGTPTDGIWTDRLGNIIDNGIYQNTTPGIDTLFYRFTDNNFCSNQDFLTVCVLSNPVAQFLLNTLDTCVGMTITTINTSNTLSDCQIASYHWSVTFEEADCHTDSMGWAFATGNSNSIQPSFNFQRSGEYQIQLEVANNCDTVRTSQTVMIGAVPQVQIDSFSVLCDSFIVQPSASVELCNSSNSSTPIYEWAFPEADLVSFSGPSPPLISYADTGTYTIFLTVTNACGTTFTNYTFSIFALPALSIFNDSPTCEADSVQLSVNAPNAIEYDWNGPNGFQSDQPNPILPNVSLDEAGVYTLVVTDVEGCTNLDMTNVQILPQPNVEIFSLDSTICFGSMTSLFAISDTIYTYTWSPSNGLDTLMGHTVNASPDTSTLYSLIAVNSQTGCESHQAIQVIVNPLPLVDAGAQIFTCTGADVQLNGTPSGGEWRDTLGNIIVDGVYNSNGAGTDLVFYQFTDLEGCSSIDSLEICVANIPLASFSIDTMMGCQPLIVNAVNTSNTLLDCSSSTYNWTVKFNGADCHNDSTAWSFINGGPNTTDASFELSLSGDYTIELEVINDCDRSVVSRNVTVGALPTGAIMALPNLCNEFVIQPVLVDLLACNSPLTDIEWSFGPDASIDSWSGEIPPEITFAGSGLKVVEVSLTNACGENINNIVAQFNIFEIPSISINNEGPVCEGDTIQISATSNTGTLYNWTGPNNFSSSNPSFSIVDVQIEDIGSYQVTVSNPTTGCENQAETLVEVNALPVVDAGMDLEYCPEDGIIQLEATPSGVSGTWTGDGISFDGQLDPINWAGDKLLAVYTFIDSTTQCSNSDTVQIEVFPQALNQVLTDTLCSEESIELNGTTYDINNPNGVEVFTSSISGCDSLRLAVNLGFRVLDMEIYTEMPNCFDGNDGSITIENISGGVPPYTLNFNGAPLFIIDTFPFEINRLSAGIYDLIAEDLNGCQEMELGVFVENPSELQIDLGEDQEIEQGDSIELDINFFSLFPLSFDPDILWTANPMNNSISCDTCVSTFVSPLETTIYTAVYTDEQGCMDIDEIEIAVDTTILVYVPNAFSPNGDGANDYLNIYIGKNIRRVNIFQIFSRWGALVYEARDFQIDLLNLGWDGWFKGKPMNPAVFVYWAEVEKIDGTRVIVKGDITLMR